MAAEKKLTDLVDNYVSPRWSGEILDCSMPMTFDQYSRCSFDCLYCFSFFQRSLKKYNPNNSAEKIYTEVPPVCVNVEQIKRMFNGEKQTEFSGYIQDKITMQWGGLSDPFDMFEKKYGVGLAIMQHLHALKYPLCFSTKGTWWIKDEKYVPLFRNNSFWNVKMSIINLDSDKARLMERGVPSPYHRLSAMEDLNKIMGKGGGGITLRLRPFIIGYSDAHNDYLNLIQLAAKVGATAVSTEFFCMEGRMTAESRERFDAMSEVIGMDLIDFYQKNSTNATGYMRLNWKIKQPYVLKMKALCDKLGMRFYVSDAHHKDLCHNGSCCGLPENWNYVRGQFTDALVIAKQNGQVTFTEVAQRMPDCWKEINVVSAVGLNVARGTPQNRAKFGNFSIFDYFRYIWNTPNNPKSPYKYFHGVLKPVKLDANKDVIYSYEPFPVEE